jgi:hypothetical protein
MTKLTDLENRIKVLLGDEAGTRFSATLLGEAVHLSLDALAQHLPLICSSEASMESSGRDLLLTLPGCLYLIHLGIKRGTQATREMEPEGEFTYQFEGEQIHLHFSGSKLPKAGDALYITYAQGYSLEGLDGAVESTLPADQESLLVCGAAGQACLLRAAGLTERYGSRPEEVTRLISMGQLRLEEFNQSLNGLKVLQEFGFPPGFQLDKWDQGKRF